MKRILRIVMVFVILLLIGFEGFLLFTGNMYVNKVVYMTLLSGKSGPDIDELNLFPSHHVEYEQPQPWPLSVHYNQLQPSGDLMQRMMEYQTVAYLVIREDSILYEMYQENYDTQSYSNSFSMAKSITGILIGCALKDGLIQSLDQPVGDFLDEFKSGEKSKITIRHLLTMSSGLDFKEEYASPFAWPAEAYYGPDVNALTLKADTKEESGKWWEYKGGDTQLLGMILRKVTGKSVASYASERLWRKLGAVRPAFWSMDEKGMEKVSCCFYTNARDFARLAELFLHQGNWNGHQVVDSSYVRESLTSATLTKHSGEPSTEYGYQWWLTTYKRQKVFYMRGIRGQYVFAIPGLHTTIVRLGHRRAKKNGDALPSDIFVYLDAGMSMVSRSHE